MNVFVLHTNPYKAAEYHCDQHLHKMILESAQIVSTAIIERQLMPASKKIYKPTHLLHPSVQWACKSNHHIHWVCTLASALNSIRGKEHKSMAVVQVVLDFLQSQLPYASWRYCETFAFAGPSEIKERDDLSIEQKYRAYYRLKFHKWRSTTRPMTFAGRAIPPFMKDLPWKLNSL